MVVRFVRVIRVPACAREPCERVSRRVPCVSRLPPVSFFTEVLRRSSDSSSDDLCGLRGKLWEGTSHLMKDSIGILARARARPSLRTAGLPNI